MSGRTLPTELRLGSCAPNALVLLRRDPQRVVFASPYLTSPAAEEIIGTSDPATSVVLTTFRAEVFASGASALSTFKWLLSSGYTVRHLDGLHAKLIITDNACIVGSQNLTNLGRRNKEASAIINDQTTTLTIKETISRWLKLSTLVTPEMVEEMELSVSHLKAAYDAFAQLSQQTDSSIEQNQDRRDFEKRSEEERQLRLATEYLVSKTRAAYEPLHEAVNVTQKNGSVWLALRHTPARRNRWDYYTLAATSNEDLTSLQAPTLTKRSRYLLIVPRTGKLAWVAANKTRLTQFGMDLSPSDSAVRINGRSWIITHIDFNDKLETLPEWNVRFDLVRLANKVQLFMRFTLADLVLSDVKTAFGNQDLSARVAEDFQANKDVVLPQLYRRLLTPFRYSSNSKGVSADRFCEGLGTDFLLTARSYRRYRFLALEGIH